MTNLTKEEKEKRKEHYRQNKEVYKEKARLWKRDNPEKVKESSRKSRENLENKTKIKNSWLKQIYGITLEDYTKLFHKQQGQCAICKRPFEFQNFEDKPHKTANVDHCHITGKIRGLLCNSCNRGIGFLQESSTLLRIAAEYLDDSSN